MSDFVTRDEESKVVHPHGCPKCGSDQLNRIHRAWEEIEQPLDRLWTYYEGLVGLKAAVASGAPRTVVAAGVNGHRIVCVDCGYKGDLREFVTEARALDRSVVDALTPGSPGDVQKGERT